jgi:hypothetical protein
VVGWEYWWPRLKPYLLGLAIVLALIGFRKIQMRGYPKGENHLSVAPNELSRAYVGMYTDKRFFGGTVRYYDTIVEKLTPGGQWIPVHNEAVEDEYVRAQLDFTNLDKIIRWSSDSTIVFFNLGATQIRVEVPL